MIPLPCKIAIQVSKIIHVPGKIAIKVSRMMHLLQ